MTRTTPTNRKPRHSHKALTRLNHNRRNLLDVARAVLAEVAGEIKAAQA